MKSISEMTNAEKIALIKSKIYVMRLKQQKARAFGDYQTHKLMREAIKLANQEMKRLSKGVRQYGNKKI